MLLNELEELKKKLSAENAAESLEKARKQYKDKMKELEENADPVEQLKQGEKLKSLPEKDTKVIVISLGKEATVVETNSKTNKVRVMSGAIKMWVDLDDLALKKASGKQEIPKTRNVTGIRSRAEMEVKGEIDLRGMASDEAIMELDRYLDSAVLSGITAVTIIHGKGTGALRKAVQSFLKGHKAIKSYRLGVFGEGETGVTIAELK